MGLRVACALGLGLGVLLGSCTSPSFVCSGNDSCGAGTCEGSGYCSFPDAECDSGRRYGDQAPIDIAGYCVPIREDTGGMVSSSGDTTGAGQGATTDTTSVDGPVVDGSSSSGAASSAGSSSGGSSDTGRCLDYYPDNDQDGFGGEPAIEACGGAPAGYIEQSGDCDDTDDRIYPGGLGCPNPDSLIAWWRFENSNGNEVENEVTDGGTAVLTGLPTLGDARGPYGSSLLIDAVTESAEIVDTASLVAPDGVFQESGTFAAWVRPEQPLCDVVTCGGMILYFGLSGTGGDGFGSGPENHLGFLESTMGDFRWRGFLNSDTLPCHLEGSTVELGVWAHVAMTWRPDSCSLYIDGQLVDTEPVAAILPGAESGWIGRPNVATERAFQGVIDEVMIFNEERSAEQVSADCSCG